LGYPQYSALISSYDFFFAFRSFRRLRARILLKRQNDLYALEAQMDQMDREEDKPILATCQNERDITRAAILSEIESKLNEYGISIFEQAPFRRLLPLRRPWLTEMP